MNGEIDIYSYTNYRKLLQDYYEQEKAKAPDKFSFRFFTRRAGFTSPNFLQLVIKGERNLGHESIHRFARVMGLNKRETFFFESLILFNQSSDPQEKGRAFEKVISFREYRSAKKLVSEQYEYFSKWYYPVIREMVNLEDFREAPAWIAKKLQPPISRSEAEEALRRLESLKLIVRDARGRLSQTDQNLATEEEVRQPLYHRLRQQPNPDGRRGVNRTGGKTYEAVQGRDCICSRRFFRQFSRSLAGSYHEPPWQ